MKKLLALIAVAPLTFAGCGGNECGPGTVAMNGECVASDDGACGPGTKLENGQCVPEINVKCGPGTTLVMGECRLDGTSASCATGTTLEAGVCVPSEEACGTGTTLDATGVCVPDGEIVCGAGTVENEDGLCVPDPDSVCQPGTTYDPSSGSCAPDVTCRSGEVAVGGVCLSPEEVDASNADVTESTPDDNDPNHGGTPESLPTPAIGDSTIFTGQIGAPVDLDGDGRPDQDWDYVTFTATAGATFEIVLRSLGSTTLGFVVTGPNGFSRTSPLYFEPEPSRYVVAPYGGTYTIAVAPQLRIENLSDGAPEGGDEYDYVLVLEQEMFPAAANLDKDSSATGSLRDLTDNLLLVKADAGDVIRLEFPSAGPDALPALMTFDGAGNFLSEMTSLPAQGLVHRAANADDLMILLDWTRLVGPEDGFEVVSVAVLPNDVGQLPPDGTATSSASIPAGETGYFQATVTAGQIVELDAGGGVNAPDLRVIGPDGRTAASALDTRFVRFYADVGGRYTVEVESNDTQDGVFTLDFTSVTPVTVGPIGTMSATTATTAVWNPAVAPQSRAYFVLENADPIQADIAASQSSNVNLGLFVFDTGFDVLRMDQFGGLAPALSPFLPAAGRSIVEVFNNSGANDATGVTLDITARTLPPLESEPNDARTTATPLPLDTNIFGEIEQGDDDFYRITLSQPLGADELLEIRALEGTTTDEYTCQLQTGTGALLEEQAPRQQGCVIFADGLAAGDYFFRIQTAGTTLRVYQVVSRIVPGVREAEPNDAPPGNTTIDLTGAVPTYGEIPLNTDTDVFSFTLASDLPADQFLQLLVEEVGTNPTGTMDANLQGPGGIDTTFGVDPSGSIIRSGLLAGEYRITISRTSANAAFDGHYRITVSESTVSVTEAEPNDDPTQAQDLGALPAAASGLITPPTTGDDDFYSFDLPADLAPDETLVVLLFRSGVNPSQSLRVSLFDDGGGFLGSSNLGDPRAVTQTGLAAGTYYVRVDATFNTSIDTDYLLTVSVE